jgi:hypothetical protein
MELLVSASPGLSHLLLPYSLPLRLCAFATLRSLLLSCLPLYPSTLCVLAPLRPCVPFFSSALNTRTKRGDSPRVFSLPSELKTDAGALRTEEGVGAGA